MSNGYVAIAGSLLKWHGAPVTPKDHCTGRGQDTAPAQRDVDNRSPRLSTCGGPLRRWRIGDFRAWMRRYSKSQSEASELLGASLSQMSARTIGNAAVPSYISRLAEMIEQVRLGSQ